MVPCALYATLFPYTTLFRSGRAVKFFLEDECGVEKGNWQKANASQKEAVALLSGKSANQEKLNGHKHARFGLYLDPETGKPTRLLAWRSVPFTPAEQRAIGRAAFHPFSLGFRERSPNRRGASQRDPWKIHCVPLDSVVPLPPGFDSSQAFLEWESMTPFVPARHAFDRRGKPKPGEDPLTQLHKELERLSLNTVEVVCLNRNNQPTPNNELGNGEWVKTHRTKRQSGDPSNTSKRGFRFRIIFSEPVFGPIALGHSSHYGLGLFVPVDDAQL